MAQWCQMLDGSDAVFLVDDDSRVRTVVVDEAAEHGSEVFGGDVVAIIACALLLGELKG